MFDAWTSATMRGFLGITCHFLDSGWNICSNLMSFSELDGPHTGENIGGMLLAEIGKMVSLTKVSPILIFIFYYSIVMTSITR